MKDDILAKLKAAEAYINLGYNVIPCVKGGKEPFGKFAPHGFKDATNDPNKIYSWWGMYPELNIGISTANPLLVVIDVDIEAESVWFNERRKEFEQLGAPIVQSPRKGLHFYFKRPPNKQWRPNASILAPHIDIRTNGSYIVAPPSSIINGSYIWLNNIKPYDDLPYPPDWLIDALDRIFKSPSNSIIDENIVQNQERKIKKGVRNYKLFKYARLLAMIDVLSEEERFEILNMINNKYCYNETGEKRCPLDEKEIRTLVQQGKKYVFKPAQVNELSFVTFIPKEAFNE